MERQDAADVAMSLSTKHNFPPWSVIAAPDYRRPSSIKWAPADSIRWHLDTLSVAQPALLGPSFGRSARKSRLRLHGKRWASFSLVRFQRKLPPPRRSSRRRRGKSSWRPQNNILLGPQTCRLFHASQTQIYYCHRPIHRLA